MKILSCYIDNFGKLHNMKCSLKDGFNMMNADNGWGKSTFGAFIRTMFYGMNQKKSGAKFDKWDYRRNYQPWQGGKFGGCITFEYKNKEYRLERYFGSKISEDTFSLIDLKTMQVSNDFGPQIGQEIFGIDGEGFERSAYIPQNELFIEANDSINNRLLGLVEDENDMSRFSVAIKALDKARRELVKTGGRG
ncbi:MAG: AAA family ATPase, partial [Lachnospiraceae bacterium]|nr:AAA family ATPase [Lachnospiraceae bacterium]